ncbi:tyrosinase family oxidase copper chaperone [Streptomyces sp. NPDC005202]|uniref:tyrosinase family oxidase copper chaperone n=1 Tax=Streptomyces sp. NPDC005202 TaxID=3157021 RepID=UPI0033A1AC11
MTESVNTAAHSASSAAHSASSAAHSMRAAAGAPAFPADASSPSAGGCPSPVVNHRKATGRRRVLRGLLASGAGVALAPVVSALGSTGSEEPLFGETYRGRRIDGIRYDAGRSGDDASGAWHVTVDGLPLHLMRRADGSWMTMIDHYQSYPTPLAAARAAVDELGPTTRPGAPDGSAGRMDDSGMPSGRRGSEGDHLHGVHA